MYDQLAEKITRRSGAPHSISDKRSMRCKQFGLQFGIRLCKENETNAINQTCSKDNPVSHSAAFSALIFLLLLAMSTSSRSNIGFLCRNSGLRKHLNISVEKTQNIMTITMYIKNHQTIYAVKFHCSDCQSPHLSLPDCVCPQLSLPNCVITRAVLFSLSGSIVQRLKALIQALYTNTIVCALCTWYNIIVFNKFDGWFMTLLYRTHITYIYPINHPNVDRYSIYSKHLGQRKILQLWCDDS